MRPQLISLYPFKFQPILKEKVWGGDKLKSVLHKNTNGPTGESWEISGVDNNISIINNGPLSGKTLNWLLEAYGADLVGEEVYGKFGNTFPLLFKFIDARENLSVQVHPNDEMAKKKHNSFGKSEMWYVLDADEDSNLIVGFKKDTKEKEYREALSESRITEILNYERVKKGDTFVMYPGTVHAIGSGVLLAEIQQTSDITYRIYDWDRPDTNGKMRELHTDLAAEAINFSLPSPKSRYRNQMDVPIPLGGTEYFALNKFDLSKPLVRDLTTIKSFKVYMCIDGTAEIKGEHYSQRITKGETLLVPAQLSSIIIDTKEASFLEAYIP